MEHFSSKSKFAHRPRKRDVCVCVCDQIVSEKERCWVCEAGARTESSVLDEKNERI